MANSYLYGTFLVPFLVCAFLFYFLYDCTTVYVFSVYVLQVQAPFFRVALHDPCVEEPVDTCMESDKQKTCTRFSQLVYIST